MELKPWKEVAEIALPHVTSEQAADLGSATTNQRKAARNALFSVLSAGSF
jgi:hypothetical protein